MIRFVCGSCGASVSAPEDCQGRVTTCRYCRKPITVPVTGTLLSRGPRSQVPQPRRGRRWGVLAAGAGLLVVLGMGVILYGNFGGRDEGRQDTTLAKAETKNPTQEEKPAEVSPSLPKSEKGEAPEEGTSPQPAKQKLPEVPAPRPTPPKTEESAKAEPPVPKDQPPRPAKSEPKPAIGIKEIEPKKTRPAPKPPPAPPVVAEPADRAIAGKTLAQWIKYVPSRDPCKREDAIRMVCRFSPERALEAVPLLIAELKEHGTASDTSTRLEATIALGLILSAAAKPDPDVVTDAVAALTKMLGDRQEIVKTRAADALGKIGPAASSAVPLLLTLIHDRPSWQTRQAAATALGSIAWDRGGKTSPPPEVVAGLKSALVDPAAPVRLAAVKALSPLGASAQGQQKADILTIILASAHSGKEDPVVRIWAHMASMYVANQVGDEHVEAIAVFLKHADSVPRIQAAKALAFVGPKAALAVPQLLGALNAEDADVVLSCIEALAGICKEPTPAVAILQQISKDIERPAAIRQAAERAVAIITGKHVEK